MIYTYKYTLYMAMETIVAGLKEDQTIATKPEFLVERRLLQKSHESGIQEIHRLSLLACMTFSPPVHSKPLSCARRAAS